MKKMKHVCNRDKEITALQVNEKWMKQTIDQVVKSVKSIDESVNRDSGNIAGLKKALNGNGDDGLIKKHNDLKIEVTEIKEKRAKEDGVRFAVFVGVNALVTLSILILAPLVIRWMEG